MGDLLKELKDLSSCNEVKDLKSSIGNSPLIICGDGNSYKFFEEIALKPFGISPHLILDKKYTSLSNVNGILRGPYDDVIIGKFPKESFVIIAIGDKESALQVSNFLGKNGLLNVHNFQDIYEYNIVYGKYEDVDSIPRLFDDESSQINLAYGLLQDQRSKNIFRSIVSTHLSRVLQNIDSDAYSDQYFPSEIFKALDYSNFLQLGAYDGDTIKNLMAKEYNPKYIAAFEPDPENFFKLSKYFINFENNKNYKIYPYAVCEVDGSVSFSENGGPTGRIGSEDLTSRVRGVALDNFELGFIPSFTVIDVEGYEMNALIGMKKMLVTHKPNIAIAVYHYPTDIYRLLLWFWNLNSDYKFYIRNYSGCVVDTVLYCRNY